MQENSVFLPVETVKRFIYDAFIQLGVPEEDACTAAEVLIASDLRGIESHGIGRMKMYFDRIRQGVQFPVTEFEIVRESPTTAVVDGHHGMGQVIGFRAMSLAIQKAKKYGMGSVAVRNSTHFGIAGYYPLMATKEYMIGFTVTNARPSIAPTFGVRPMLGTNPIAFGAPSDEPFPFLFDAATSITQRGKLEVLARKKKPAPAGWVIDNSAQTLTDPETILQDFATESAALLPLGGLGEVLGGHKGYGLATMVEILSASLQSGAFLWDLIGFDADGNRRPNMLGHFFMAIDVAAFVDPDDFKHSTGEILRQLRAATLQPGQAKIYSAGEKEYHNEIRVRQNGVEILPDLQKDMQTIARELGLTGYNFPF